MTAEIPAGRRRRRPGRRTAVVAGCLAALVAVPLVVHELTPRPYVYVFNRLIGTIDSAVELGPLAGRIAGVEETDVVAVPVPGAPDAGLTIFTPPGRAPAVGRPVVLLVHGGGWVTGRADQLAPFSRLLASEGYTVASLDYSLAPGETYPTPLRQASAALDHLVANAAAYGVDPQRVFLAGNSAGAQISSQLAAMISEPAFARRVGVDVRLPAASLKGVVLWSGPYDFDTADRAGFGGFRSYVWAYTGRKDFEDHPRIDELSTVRTATDAYPPTYLTAGDADPLEPQTYELDAVLRAKGVDVTSRYWTGTDAGLEHDYQFDLQTEQARTAYDDVVAFLAAHSR